ncbi:uridine diphosphate-N-acetylglucosamine-binding protein YvcK [Parasalinivibrio latis]|uniref:uridine diphosphate-N-acetylglucosamine-binding protein YvcK n=1 Tax=Parasalinivibrio latis TaxID=2952610 RepID=UPI0030DF9D7D
MTQEQLQAGNDNIGKKIVAIGGGHGLGRMLSALRDHGSNVTGIVTTTDNGGSTGRIRACQGGIAWGDTRNCINQLITEPSVGSMIFEYRFRGNGELNGHNLGNLMLKALDNLCIRPLDAINLIRDMLKVEPQIVPMTEHPSDLAAVMFDGQEISGETNIDELDAVPQRLFIDPPVPATKEAVDAIKQADVILLGPGSFMTSVMPPLLLPEMGKALKSAEAKIVFVANLDKEFGPAGLMNLEEMLVWCQRAMGGRMVDIVLGDENLPELPENYVLFQRDLPSAGHAWRHDREQLGKAVEEIVVFCK